jgi:hypothetical protein
MIVRSLSLTWLIATTSNDLYKYRIVRFGFEGHVEQVRDFFQYFKTDLHRISGLWLLLRWLLPLLWASLLPGHGGGGSLSLLLGLKENPARRFPQIAHYSEIWKLDQGAKLHKRPEARSA